MSSRAERGLGLGDLGLLWQQLADPVNDEPPAEGREEEEKPAPARKRTMLPESEPRHSVVDPTVDGIMVQFRVSSLELVPECLRSSLVERPKPVVASRRVEGVRFISRTPGVDPRYFAGDLGRIGFHLRSAQALSRTDDNGRVSCTVRFIWGRILGQQEDEGAAERKTAFLELAERAVWSVSAHRNPGTGEREGRSGISIDLTDRRPFVGADGRVITKRRRWNGHGRRTGVPEPIRPSYSLRIGWGERGFIQLVPNR